MQKLRFSKYLKVFIIVLDLMVLVALFGFFSESKDLLTEGVWNAWEEFIFYCLFLSGIWVSISAHTRLYDIPRNLTYTLFLERIIIHTFLFSVGVVFLGKLRGQSILDTGGIVFALSLSAIIISVKSFVFFLLKYIRKLGINHRNAMFLGNENEALTILENTLKERKDYGYHIYTFSDAMNLDKLKVFWKEKGIHTVFLPMQNSGLDREMRKQIFKAAEKYKVKITLVPEVDKNNFSHYELSYVESIPILVTSKLPLEYLFNRLLKRIMDIFLSLIVLIFIGTWLFPILALIIWLDNKGPIFFVQKRYGKNQEVFSCYKFRTMVVNPHSATSVTRENDDRITAFGKFLRKMSLDELPQFINVFLGQMSVVGPRPHMLLVDDYYRTKIERYDFRNCIKPGITGLAQVNGLRGDSGDMNIEMKKRLLADAFYIKNWSITLDFIIMLKTIYILFTGDSKAR